MGTPLPDNEPRSTCSLCWGPNPIIGPIQPRWLTITFAGVQPGDLADEIVGPMPAGPWLVELVENCAYRMNYPDHIISVDFTPTRTMVEWQDRGFFFLFVSPTLNGPCKSRVTNAYQSYLSTYAWGGTAVISYSSEGLTP